MPYFYKHIGCGNTLSKSILDKVDLTTGYFFTILPEEANFEDIENLKYGGILPNKEIRKPHPKGKGSPSSGRGNWFNEETGESYHPDLDHPPPHGPHWDYVPEKNHKGYRIHPDGRCEPKP